MRDESRRGADEGGFVTHATRSAPRRAVPAGLAIVIALWAGGVVAGMGVFLRYKNTPGAASTPLGHWPEGAALTRDAARPTLVMVVHPKCSCSRASLGELEKLMSRLAGRVSAHVLFVKPEGVGDEWENTELRASAERIPGVSVSTDAGCQQG